jgi:hypothetical protein
MRAVSSVDARASESRREDVGLRVLEAITI